MVMTEYLDSDKYLKERALTSLSLILQNLVRKEYDPVNVADLGCGDGRGLDILKSMLLSNGINIGKFYAVDINPAVKNNIDIEIVKTDLNAGSIPIQDGCIHVAYSMETIEHLLNPKAFIRDVRRILAKDGIFVITTPNILAWYNRVLFLLGSLPIHYEVTEGEYMAEDKKYGRLVAAHGNMACHIRVFSSRALTELLKDNGFEILQTKGLRFILEKENFWILSFPLRPVSLYLQEKRNYNAINHQ